MAWFLFTFTILYVTLSPFDFHFDAGYLRAHIQNIDWFPIFTRPGYTVNWQDNVNNVILFMPLGFLGFWSVGRPSRWKCIVLVAVGFLFSTSIEFTQLFIETRDTQLSDILTNTSGMTLGVWLASKASLG